MQKANCRLQGEIFDEKARLRRNTVNARFPASLNGRLKIRQTGKS
jgi:hypothetical protein